MGVSPLRWRLAAGSIYSTGEVVGSEASETGGEEEREAVVEKRRLKADPSTVGRKSL